jgi:O-antigen/teichoic acid export membrane protein
MSSGARTGVERRVEATEPVVTGRPDARAGPSLLTAVAGLVDQGLLSFASFWVVLVAARSLDPAAFGWFTTALTSVVALNALQGALVVQPYAVLAADPAHRRTLSTATAVLQALLSALVVVGTALVAAAVLAFEPSYTALVIACGLSAVCWQAQELVRRSFYAAETVRRALGVDVITYGSQVVALTLLLVLDVGTSARFFVVIAVTALVGAAYGIRRSALRVVHRVPVRSTLRAQWRIGRWLVAATVAYLLSFHLYFYELAFKVDPAAAGELKVAQTVLAPLNVVFLYTVTTLPVRLSAAPARGERFSSAIAAHVRVTGPLILGYCAVVLAFQDAFTGLFGSTYEENTSTILAIAAFYLASYAFQLAYCVFTALHETRPVFLGQAGAGVVGLLAGWPLIAAFGVLGAALGMALGAVVSVLIVGGALVTEARRRSALGAPRRTAGR